MTERNKHRLFLSVFFFVSGFSFSTWASRIPTIKDLFNLNAAELGTLLLCMPVSSLVGLPFSGWLISRFDTRVPLAYGFICNAIALTLIGFAHTLFFLVPAICLYAFTLRILNIAVNTQAITVQKLFEKKIMGSFHGLWSTGGIIGVGFSTLFLAFSISMPFHLLTVSLIMLAMTLFSYRFLVRNDRAETGNKIIIGKPDSYILCLGLLVFFAAICEGGMFDWSGIYFQRVLNLKIFTYGYLIFMVFMAFSRFVSDLIVKKAGMPATYVMSSVCIMTGIAISTLFPTFINAMIGFSMVGFGTAAVVPMSYLLGGNSTKYSAGMAVSIIATYYIAGMLLGPPLIGYLAHAFNLRVAFVCFGFSGMMLIPISRLFFNFQQKAVTSIEA